MTTCAEYEQMLADAIAALHQLQIGGKVVTVRAGEKQIEYSKANLADLQSYVNWLQGKVDACNGIRSNRRRMIGVIPLG